MVIALCGAVLFAANVAPTEEIIMIATESHMAKLVGIALLSIALTAMILYYIEFTGSRRFVRRDGVASVVVGTVISYAVALAVSAMMLWFFGRFDAGAAHVCLAGGCPWPGCDARGLRGKASLAMTRKLRRTGWNGWCSASARY